MLNYWPRTRYYSYYSFICFIVFSFGLTFEDFIQNIFKWIPFKFFYSEEDYFFIPENKYNNITYFMYLSLGAAAVFLKYNAKTVK